MVCTLRSSSCDGAHCGAFMFGPEVRSEKTTLCIVLVHAGIHSQHGVNIHRQPKCPALHPIGCTPEALTTAAYAYFHGTSTPDTLVAVSPCISLRNGWRPAPCCSAVIMRILQLHSAFMRRLLAATKPLAPFNGDKNLLGFAYACANQCSYVSHMFLQERSGNSVPWQQDTSSELGHFGGVPTSCSHSGGLGA